MSLQSAGSVCRYSASCKTGGALLLLLLLLLDTLAGTKIDFCVDAAQS
jgi:hypothetical protein